MRKLHEQARKGLVQADLTNFLRLVDRDKDNKVRLDELRQYVLDHLSSVGPRSHEHVPISSYIDTPHWSGDCSEVFAQLDKNASNFISKAEFMNCLSGNDYITDLMRHSCARYLHCRESALDSTDFETYFNAVDSNRSGCITQEELTNHLVSTWCEKDSSSRAADTLNATFNGKSPNFRGSSAHIDSDNLSQSQSSAVARPKRPAARKRDPNAFAHGGK